MGNSQSNENEAQSTAQVINHIDVTQGATVETLSIISILLGIMTIIKIFEVIIFTGRCIMGCLKKRNLPGANENTAQNNV